MTNSVASILAVCSVLLVSVNQSPTRAAQPDAVIKTIIEAQQKRLWLKRNADGRTFAWPMTFMKFDRGLFNFDVAAASGAGTIELWCKLPINDTNETVVSALSRGDRFICSGKLRALGGIRTSTTVVIEHATIEPINGDDGKIAAARQRAAKVEKDDAAAKRRAAEVKRLAALTRHRELAERRPSAPPLKQVLRRLGDRYTESNRQDYFDNKVEGKTAAWALRVRDVKRGTWSGLTIIGKRGNSGEVWCELNSGYEDQGRKLTKGQRFVCIGEVRSYQKFLGTTIHVGNAAIK